MRYWWVNQNQTFRQELDGGYLWSPKRNKNGHRNPFYEFMREVAPAILSFHSLIHASRPLASSADIVARVPSRRNLVPQGRTGVRLAGGSESGGSDLRMESVRRTT